MRAYPTLLGSTALLAVVLLSGCGAPGAVPVPSGSPSGAGIGADDEAALNSIELVAIDITIETEACNALREDCEEPEYVDVLVEAEPDGDPVTGPFRDGTLTVEYVGIVADVDSNPSTSSCVSSRTAPRTSTGRTSIPSITTCRSTPTSSPMTTDGRCTGHPPAIFGCWHLSASSNGVETVGIPTSTSRSAT
jgi:hypothetical protein